MRNWIIGVVAILIIGIGTLAWIYRDALTGLVAPKEEEPAPQVTQEEPTVKTYASSTMGVSFDYAPEFTLHEQYSYTGFPKKPILGVSLTLPEAMATGTNLSLDTYMSVEQLPRANNCTGDIFITANVRPSLVTENGVNYSIASTTGAAAGNRYEEVVYALRDSKPCTAVRYFIHTTELSNYPAGTIREFDRSTVLNAFDTVRRTLLVVPQ